MRPQQRVQRRPTNWNRRPFSPWLWARESKLTAGDRPRLAKSPLRRAAVPSASGHATGEDASDRGNWLFTTKLYIYASNNSYINTGSEWLSQFSTTLVVRECDPVRTNSTESRIQGRVFLQNKIGARVGWT